MEKKVIRQEIKNKRKNLSDKTYAVYAESILKRLTELKEYKEAKVVYCYIDVNHEAGTKGIIEHLFSNGKEVAVPKVEDGIINFYRIHSLKDTTPGSSFSIPEPVHNIIPHAPDIIIVPGVAFSYKLERLGYGGGYYDRYLLGKNILKIGLANEFQMFERLPVEEHDILMDMIVTEKMIYS